MKNTHEVARIVRTLGLIVLVMAIGFSFAACGGESGWTEMRDEAVEEGGRGIALLFILGVIALPVSILILKGGNPIAGTFTLIAGIIMIVMGFQALITVVGNFFRNLFGGG